MRKLASIRIVSNVLPIEGADNIEAITIDGWQCVAKKGEFKRLDPCIYFEIDSFLPTIPAFDFLAKSGIRKNGNGAFGYRLRTIKLRGTLSQGLALPVSTFFSLEDMKSLSHGEDVTERLGITKWEPPIPACLGGEAKGAFPSWIRKTDQERIQNVPHVLDDAEATYEVTVKLDGSSCTIYHHNGEFGVCSRNLDLHETEGNTFWKVARQYGLPEKISGFGNIAIQGELIGEGIQGNKERIAGHDLYVFDVWLIDEQRYATPEHRHAIVSDLGLKHVPILYYKMSAPATVADALKLADGPSLNPQTRREGWSSRSTVEKVEAGKQSVTNGF